MTKTRTIKARQLWPGMILASQQFKGRIHDVGSRGLTPWGEEKLYVTWAGFAVEETFLAHSDVKILDEID